MSAPKNCPHCKSDHVEVHSGTDRHVQVMCTECWASGPLCYTVDTAWEEWGRIEIKPDSEPTPRTPIDLALALCHEIERLPASEHQTKISLMASDLRREVEMLTIDKDTYRKAYEVTRNHEMVRGFKKANGL
jgi:hypothetical protein